MSVLSTLFPGVNLIDLFPETRSAIAAALNKEQQIFVSSNLGDFQMFLQTEAGTKAIAAFVDAWKTDSTVVGKVSV